MLYRLWVVIALRSPLLDADSSNVDVNGTLYVFRRDTNHKRIYVLDRQTCRAA